jgi:hypothetical protein
VSLHSTSAAIARAFQVFSNSETAISQQDFIQTLSKLLPNVSSSEHLQVKCNGTGSAIERIAIESTVGLLASEMSTNASATPLLSWRILFRRLSRGQEHLSLQTWVCMRHAPIIAHKQQTIFECASVYFFLPNFFR